MSINWTLSNWHEWIRNFEMKAKFKRHVHFSRRRFTEDGQKFYSNKIRTWGRAERAEIIVLAHWTCKFVAFLLLLSWSNYESNFSQGAGEKERLCKGIWKRFTRLAIIWVNNSYLKGFELYNPLHRDCRITPDKKTVRKHRIYFNICISAMSPDPLKSHTFSCTILFPILDFFILDFFLFF